MMTIFTYTDTILKKCIQNKVVIWKIKMTRQTTKIEYRKGCTLPHPSNAKMAINPRCGVKHWHLLDPVRPHCYQYRLLSLFHRQETAIK